MEVAAAVAPHDFQLDVNGFDDIASRERAPDGFRKVENGQLVRAFLAHLSDEAGVWFGEMITEFFELLMGDLEIPGRLDDAPTLLKLEGIGFAEMSFVFHSAACARRRAELQRLEAELQLSEGLGLGNSGLSFRAAPGRTWRCLRSNPGCVGCDARTRNSGFSQAEG